MEKEDRHSIVSYLAYIRGVVQGITDRSDIIKTVNDACDEIENLVCEKNDM